MRLNNWIIACVLLFSIVAVSAFAQTPYCGDGLCNGVESCSSCNRDCGSCSAPAPYCGDGLCNGVESCSSCNRDCGSCSSPPTNPPSSCSQSYSGVVCSGGCGGAYYDSYNNYNNICGNSQKIRVASADWACRTCSWCAVGSGDCPLTPHPITPQPSPTSVCGNHVLEVGEACDFGYGNELRNIYNGGNAGFCGYDTQKVCSAGCSKLLTVDNGLINCDASDRCSYFCDGSYVSTKDGYMNDYGVCQVATIHHQYCQYGCSNDVCNSAPVPSCQVKLLCQSGDVYRQNSDCSKFVVKDCEFGCSNGLCLPPPVPSCQVKLLCQSGDVYLQNSDCTKSLKQQCSNGCSGGVCVPLPPPIPPPTPPPKPLPTCNPVYFCSGSDIVHRNVDCSSVVIKNCANGCIQNGYDATCKSAPVCPYLSTQVKLISDQSSFVSHVQITQGQSVRIFGFHNNIQEIVQDIQLTISGPSGSIEIQNGALFTPIHAGSYSVRGKTGSFTSTACSSSATIFVKEKECDPSITAPRQVACGIMCGKQTLFCNSDGNFERTACADQGVCVPDAQDKNACQVGGYRECSASCQWSECKNVGVCIPGAVEAQTCGEFCGLKFRTCSSNGQWSSFGLCTSQGACKPGDSDSKSCGIDSTASRTCNSACEWGAFGVCNMQASCSPGQIEDRSCGKCGTQLRVCLSNGQYSAFSTCTSQGACYPGQGETQSCGLSGSQSRTCTNFCSWTSFGFCEEPKECSPGQTRASSCGLCGTTTDVCSYSGKWVNGSCSNQGVCNPGSVSKTSCGIDGKKERVCTNTCQWSGYGECDDSSICHPGETKTENCGMCGFRVLACNHAGQYDVGSCKEEQGSCVAGTTQLEVCGIGGSQARLCSQSCEWGPYSACSSSGQCSPGQVQTEACGSSRMGICAQGESKRICKTDSSWGSWSACVGNIEPKREVCNGRDDDCDGNIDEGIVCEYLQVKSVQVINGDCVNPGNDLFVRVVLDNLGDEDFDDLKITISSDLMNIFVRSEPFNLNDGDSEAILVPVEIPMSVSSGLYDIRVGIGNELQIQRVVYRDFVVSKRSCLQ